MRKLQLLALGAIAASTSSFAAAIKIVGSMPAVVSEPSSSPRIMAMMNQPQPKVVLLQKIKLSNQAKKVLVKKIKRLKRPTMRIKKSTTPTFPSIVNLGMNNTPVLDQGAHGSCVTFASSGAIDASLSLGDYVSELCSLNLGQYFESKDADYPSGWEGSWGTIVLKQFFNYGIVSKTNQEQYGCGGVKVYPRLDMKTGHKMSPKAYQRMSENISNRLSWQTILSPEDAFSGKKDENQLLHKVKESLYSGSRLTFGVLLDVNLGHVGAVGSYHKRHDTWMLTPAIEEDARNDRIDAGHEMIIIGYNDNVTVTAPSGHTNKGVLILRNSWGNEAGDNGNYYMSYDYFKALTDEVHQLTPLD